MAWTRLDASAFYVAEVAISGAYDIPPDTALRPVRCSRQGSNLIGDRASPDGSHEMGADYVERGEDRRRAMTTVSRLAMTSHRLPLAELLDHLQPEAFDRGRSSAGAIVD